MLRMVWKILRIEWNDIFHTQLMALGLWGGGCAKDLGVGPFLCGARENLPTASKRKYCDSEMFHAHQYTK